MERPLVEHPTTRLFVDLLQTFVNNPSEDPNRKFEAALYFSVIAKRWGLSKDDHSVVAKGIVDYLEADGTPLLGWIFPYIEKVEKQKYHQGSIDELVKLIEKANDLIE